MTQLAADWARECWVQLGGNPKWLRHLAVEGRGSLPSAFPVSDLACATIGVASLAIAELCTLKRSTPPAVSVDRRLASMWFQSSLRPIGWQLPAIWDTIAGDYPTADGWIRLHTNAPHHRAAAVRILGADESGPVTRAVSGWRKSELEAAVVEAGGCAAAMLSREEWVEHPQGMAVSGETLVDRHFAAMAAPGRSPADGARPLSGLRVLDLTRVLAGPIATRFLAGFGAEVLRIDPPHWEEPAVVPEVTLGKRCARLDLRDKAGWSRFAELIASADILVHGYRPDALENLGLGERIRRSLSPGLVEVCLDAYGWSGPWGGRRGFDSLVQMSCGIAEFGKRQAKAERPVPLPVQALDHATGYLMAAAAIRGMIDRLAGQGGSRARLSLARTAELLKSRLQDGSVEPLQAESAADLEEAIEATSWGAARRLRSPVRIEGTPMAWAGPAVALGTGELRWM